MLATALTIGLVALVVGEIAARGLERRLPSYPFWHDTLTTGKWHQLQALRTAGPVDVLLAGSSQMLMGVDPTTVVRPPQRCYNAALYRGVPRVMRQWLREEVLPATRPRLVVWGLSVLDLNDNGPFHHGVEQRFLAAPARGRGPRRWLVVHSALVRRAGLALHPRAAARMVRAHSLDQRPPWAAVLGDMGKGLEYLSFDTYQLSGTKADFVRNEIVNGFAMGGPQLQAVRELVTELKAGGTRVLLLEMPATEEFHAMYPQGMRDVEAARALLARTAADLEVPWIPVADLPQGWFADCVHLNGRGMREWTESIMVALEAEAAS